jgi:hypothetical protein
MIIKGVLNLRGSSIESLGELTEVQGDLYLRDCVNLKNLGNLKKVGGDLYLSNTKIVKFPENFKIGGSLILRDCKNLESLGSRGLEIGKNLFLGGRTGRFFSKDIQVSETLFLKNSGITKEYILRNHNKLYAQCRWDLG